MTDLREAPELTLTESIRTADCLTRAQRRWWPALTGDRDDLLSLRRALSGVYLRHREAYEDAPSAGSAEWLEETAVLLARVLAATGEADGDPRAMVDGLTVPMMAEMFVEYWADREGLLWDLDGDAVCAVADSVRDWAGDGGALNQAPMRKWVEAQMAVAR